MKFSKIRIKILIGTAVIACALFSTLIILEKNMTKPLPKKEIIAAAKDIECGEEIKNCDLKIIKCDVKYVSSDMIESTSMMKSKYALKDIYKGEILNRRKISDKSDNSRIFLKKDEKEISIPVNKINNDAFAGTLRKGDVIDITHTSVLQGENSTTELDMKKAEVVGAVDSEGRFLESSDKNVLASSIMVRGSQDEFLKISRDLSVGYFSVAKCSIMR
ncbi:MULTISPECIES: hypothetical protein [Clostridium]|uniref:hypothetical protein n=1 Tax=Clostridium TaxID=1485 RepID=UPI000824732B|nr:MULTISPECIES: hypothetical protein [Clostridium]PJI10084.1 hypothetical protein CUB90_20395 [Clostridium sp. CT7]